MFVDSAILSLTERLCRRFQLLTGRTNVWLAIQLTNLSIVMYFVWVAGLYVVTGDLALRVFVALFSAGVLLVLTGTILRVSIEASETEAYGRVARGFRNPRRIRDEQLRLSFLTLSMVLAVPSFAAYVALRQPIALLMSSLILLTTVVLYILACDPLPPCPGKIKAWVRALARVRLQRSST